MDLMYLFTSVCLFVCLFVCSFACMPSYMLTPFVCHIIGVVQ